MSPKLHIPSSIDTSNPAGEPKLTPRHAPAVPVEHIDPDDPDLSLVWAPMDEWPDEQQEDDPIEEEA